jgi:hypothetical protein
MYFAKWGQKKAIQQEKLNRPDGRLYPLHSTAVLRLTRQLCSTVILVNFYRFVNKNRRRIGGKISAHVL